MLGGKRFGRLAYADNEVGRCGTDLDDHFRQYGFLSDLSPALRPVASLRLFFSRTLRRSF